MLDSGCNSLLLPVSGTAAFSELLRLFPSTEEVGEYVWSIHTSKGVTSQSLTLKISSVSPFQVSLCSNLLCESLQTSDRTEPISSVEGCFVQSIRECGEEFLLSIPRSCEFFGDNSIGISPVIQGYVWLRC